MKLSRIILFAITALASLFIIFGTYLVSNIQGRINGFEKGNPGAEKKVLIASQGSDFKTKLVESLIEELNKKDVFVKVVDVNELSSVNVNEWNAILIIHTTEKNMPPEAVKKFLDKVKEFSKLFLVTTSGSGNWKIKDYKVDSINTASKISEIESIKSKILTWIETKI